MDFHTLSRRQLQALCKMNKIPANITNVAMADALAALPFVEGVEQLLMTSESGTEQSSIESPQKNEVTSPVVPSNGGRATAAARRGGVKVAVPHTPASTTTRRKAAASNSVRRNLEMRETSTTRHGYSTRRSTRLAEKNGEPKQISLAIKIDSFTEEMDDKEGSVRSHQGVTKQNTGIDSSIEAEGAMMKPVDDESGAVSKEISDLTVDSVEVALTDMKIEGDLKHEVGRNEPVESETFEDLIKAEPEPEPEPEDDELEIVDASKNVLATLETDMKLSSNCWDVENDTQLVSDKKMVPQVAAAAGIEIHVPEFRSGELDKEICEGDEIPDELEMDDGKEIVESMDDDKEGHLESDFAAKDDKLQKNQAAEEGMLEVKTAEDDAAAATFVSHPTEVASSPTILNTTTPMKQSAAKAPKTAAKLTLIPDGKENVDSGRKLTLTKDEKPKELFSGIHRSHKPLEDYSMRQLTKMFKEKLEISKQQLNKTENCQAVTARPPLKPLSENCLPAEPQN